MYSYPGKPLDALDGMVQVLDKNVGTGLMQYFINIVPTQHNQAVVASDIAISSHYSYTMKFKSIYGSDVSAKSTTVV